MSRPIVLANGSMHVGLNHFAEVHDLYYPYVGFENHTTAHGLQHRIGVWVNGAFSWLHEGSWTFSYTYHDQTLISNIVASNEYLNIRLEFTDCVDAEKAAFVRNVHVINLDSTQRDIRLYMHQAFVISDSHRSDTVQYLPEDNAIMHYKGRRVFFVSGEHIDGSSFDDFSTGMMGIEGREGTFRDAEDGSLQRNAVEHGRVDSVIGFYETVQPLSSYRVCYWIAAGRSPHEARLVHASLRETSVLHSIMSTSRHWHRWLLPSQPLAQRLPAHHMKPFQQALMIMKAHIDDRGAVLASLDTTMLNYSKDAYGYCWPRDAAYILWPLLRLGYTDELVNFFSFAQRGLQTNGYLYHKYQVDGALGSSWHPWVHRYGKTGPPIQTDETAIVLFLAGQYHNLHADREFLNQYYTSLIEPMANFLTRYTDANGLPLPSYDLWEQKYLTTTYTTALTYAALVEASSMADKYGRVSDSARWRAVADTMKQAASVLYNPERRCFYKGFIDSDVGERVFDDVIDVSSVFGAFMFGLFDSTSDEITTSIETVKQTLVNAREPHAFIRYEHDNYYRDGDDSTESNVWPVASLWMAQIALERGDVDFADQTLNWLLSLMEKLVVIPEQMRPQTFEAASVAPLVWSYAELVSTMIDRVQTIDAH